MTEKSLKALEHLKNYQEHLSDVIKKVNENPSKYKTMEA